QVPDKQTRTPQPASWEEVDAYRNVAIASALAPFRAMPFEEFYRLNDRKIQYLPSSVHRDAKNLLLQLRAACRTLPAGTTLESLDDDASDALRLAETMPPTPETDEAEAMRVEKATRVKKAIELIRHHVGDKEAEVIAAFLQPDSSGTAVSVARQIGVDVKTVRRMFDRLRKHQELGQALLDLLR